MSITLELTPAEEARLREAARARDMDITAFARAYLLGDLEPDETAFLRTVGGQAVAEARANLLERGIGYVEGRDGQAVRLLPGGVEEKLGDASR